MFRLSAGVTFGFFESYTKNGLRLFLQMEMLALMALLLLGVVRSGGVENIDYMEFVDTVLYATGHEK